jgi:hypothetical protein
MAFLHSARRTDSIDRFPMSAKRSYERLRNRRMSGEI